ncbi:double-stranded RNA-binding protein Staufen homolog 2-like isoform X2 [Watersipora subatra]|uniref:double-stranded RNA-binding protein Staufen homolog 2-like isoform X2 n=1 Tax=Watersipora subatra TaxID=2589382 RepID=UPI00355BC0B2
MNSSKRNEYPEKLLSASQKPAMLDTETTKGLPNPTASSKGGETVGVGLKVENPSEGSSKIQRTRTVIIDAASKSTDVGVQATPTAVSGDTASHQKPQKGILHVTSDMRKSATRDSKNHLDNHASTTNTKEKTPMCLVNELARFNKVAHKYVLVDEKGPAHRKEFKIRLDLGTETYLATGSSIKRAQHAAGEMAINQTKLTRPATKSPVAPPTPASPEKQVATVTPTVELNALAMKLGEHPEYINIEPPRVPQLPPNYLYHVPDCFYRYPPIYSNMFLPPTFRPRVNPLYSVVLRLGRHEFRGQGANKQLARHNAASRALRMLKSQHNFDFYQHVNDGEIANEPASSEANEPDAAEEDEEQPDAPSPSADSPSAEESAGSGKSEISQVHEIALRLDKTITFEVMHESGPPHMRTFVTRCVCGDLTSDGEGNSKRKSKKVAAEMMLAKLNELEQPTAISKPRVKNVANKKKNRNLIKMQKANVEYGSGINPISRLIQIQQANKRKEPVYSLVMEHGLPRRREFIMEVECNEKICQGKGPNKKLAKRNAAEEMLQQMGYSQPFPAPGKSVLKSPDHAGSSHNKHVTFVDSTQSTKLPGVIVRKDYQTDSINQTMPPFKADLAASLAKELLEKGKSVVGETLLPAKEHPKHPLKRSREQLEYLGSCMGFAIHFTDFPKGTNTAMCLTVVSLQTNPSQVFHGSASTVDDSHDKAALEALTKLAQSARDDDSVEETTPPVSHKNNEMEEREKQNACGDSDKPILNGQKPELSSKLVESEQHGIPIKEKLLYATP